MEINGTLYKPTKRRKQRKRLVQLLEQDGEHGDLRVKYGKMWLMEKKKDE